MLLGESVRFKMPSRKYQIFAPYLTPLSGTDVMETQSLNRQIFTPY
jgi:hypothetical protein